MIGPIRGNSWRLLISLSLRLRVLMAQCHTNCRPTDMDLFFETTKVRPLHFSRFRSPRLSSGSSGHQSARTRGRLVYSAVSHGDAELCSLDFSFQKRILSYNNTLCDFYVALKMRIKEKRKIKRKTAARTEEEEEDEDDESKDKKRPTVELQN